MGLRTERLFIIVVVSIVILGFCSATNMVSADEGVPQLRVIRNPMTMKKVLVGLAIMPSLEVTWELVQ